MTTGRINQVTILGGPPGGLIEETSPAVPRRTEAAGVS